MHFICLECRCFPCLFHNIQYRELYRRNNTKICKGKFIHVKEGDLTGKFEWQRPSNGSHSNNSVCIGGSTEYFDLCLSALCIQSVVGKRKVEFLCIQDILEVSK